MSSNNNNNNNDKPKAKEDKSFREILSYWAVKEPTKGKDKATSPVASKSPSVTSVQSSVPAPTSVATHDQASASVEQVLPSQPVNIEQPVTTHAQEQSQTVPEQQQQHQQEQEQQLVNDILQKVEQLDGYANVPANTNVPAIANAYDNAHDNDQEVVGDESEQVPTSTSNNIQDQPIQLSVTSVTSYSNSIGSATPADLVSSGWAQVSRVSTNPYVPITRSDRTESDDDDETSISSDRVVGQSDSGSGYSSSYSQYGGSASGGNSNAYDSEVDSYLAYSTGYKTQKPKRDINIFQHNIPKVDITRPGAPNDEPELVAPEKGWNETFQQLLDLPDSEAKYETLSNFANNFVYSANTFGKIIISERNVPDEFKTIKPLEIGGVAGGQKFKCNDIIFKFVVDTEIAPGVWMYGDTTRSDEKAQKSASHELKGLNHFMDHSKGIIRFPLVSIIDYAGYRLLAVSCLPITKSSIVYGSNDGGRTMHNSEPIVEAEMIRMAGLLNIKGHFSGLTTPTLIYGPGDIEVHKGSDNRFYMIDFARTFPPEYPKNSDDYIGREIFYALLRPELVKLSKTKLSSDALSGWQSGKDEEECNTEVHQATQILHDEAIPECAELISKSSEEDKKLERERQTMFYSDFIRPVGTKETEFYNKIVRLIRLVNLVHARGINLRYLGHVCQRITDHSLKQLLMTELVARVWKKIIKAMIREKIEKTNRPTTEPQRVISDIFALLLDKKHKSDYNEFWTLIKFGTFKFSAINAFPGCLSPAQMSSEFDLRPSFDCKLLVARLVQMLGIQINSDAFSQFINNPHYIINLHDIERMDSTAKYPAVIDMASGSSLIYKIQKMSGIIPTPPEVIRWVDIALNKLRSASRSMPQSPKIILKQALTYITLANMNLDASMAFKYLTCANHIVRELSLNELSTDDRSQVLALWGIIHVKMASIDLFHNFDFVQFNKGLDTAQDMIERSLAINPIYMDLYLKQCINLDPPVNSDWEVSEGMNKSIVRELISIKYLIRNISVDGYLRTFISLAIEGVKYLSGLEVIANIAQVIDDQTMEDLFDSLPNLFTIDLTKAALSPWSCHLITKMKYLRKMTLCDFHIKKPKYKAEQQPGDKPVSADEDLILEVDQFLRRLLSNCTMLSCLKVDIRWLEDKHLQGMAQYMGNLTELYINCKGLTDAIIIEIAPYLKNVTKLSLTQSYSITDKGIIAAIESCNPLSELSVSMKLTDECGKVIANKACNLTSLSIYSCRFSAQVISDILRNAPLIETCDLTSTSADDSCLAALASHGAKNLKRLYLAWTSAIASDEPSPDLEEFLSKCNLSNLKLLQMSQYKGEYNLLWRLLGKMPNLVELDLPNKIHLPSFIDAHTALMDNAECVQEVALGEITKLRMLMSIVSLQSLIAMLELAPQMERLSLSAMTFINEKSYVIELNDSVVDAMCPYLQHIKELDLSNLAIDKRQVSRFIKSCPQLVRLCLNNCKQITAQIAYDLGFEYPNVTFEAR
ncbi:hypothetical protein SAMD00019534_048080 [Acytostelium subglobosum LB1]|uniref:hypothetical protein n=1 Tax=Acytostelium subglobosum LB1 TaxID=1410327 RepID=UPI000644DBE0|nr:hypothetical protein SAMD00019534_048080 [Acytostelium subglobosum LB1]GAM21633.1 hypothetical protein SAMD00019534_048080 [Acytostelium subglobosum LB1]|eukprot:XP_012755752.1 hypothetical protein SAMD00019534_048080 [Acytostelium subglobosum LB1]